MFLPIYFLNYDGGQSPLYIYIGAIFVKIFSLNLWATRLPMAIISSISIYIFYKIIIMRYDENDAENRFNIIFALLFFVINPYHIMKSRWGLDCNLFPELMLLGVYFLIKFLNGKKNKDFFIAFIVLAISSYTYATSYLALPIFCILVYVYCIKYKFINYKMILQSLIIVLIITWPLILFIIVNFFDLDNIEFVFMTIPKLKSNRMSLLTSFSINNIIRLFKILILQYDFLYYNAIRGVGIYYIYSFPVLIFGVIKYIKEKYNRHKDVSFIDDVFMMWLLSSVVLAMFLKEININRINFMIIPLIYFVIKGFIYLFSYISKMKYKVLLNTIIILVLTINFTVFLYKYVDLNIKKENLIEIDTYNTNKDDTFLVGLDDVITYIDTLNADRIYALGIDAMMDVYVSYYLKLDPKTHFNKRIYFKDSKAAHILSNWYFEKPVIMNDINGKKYINMANQKGVVYIIRKSFVDMVDTNIYNIKYFGKYAVCEPAP